MTTRPTPPRTMLPPALTRHYYEVRRQLAEREGKQTAPWYLLTAAERDAVEQDVEILRQAIRRAEEEQALVAQYQAPAAPTETAEPAAAEAAEPTAEPKCPGCVLCVLVRLLEQALEEEGPAVREATDKWLAEGPDLFTYGPTIPLASFDSPPITFADLQRAAAKEEERNRRSKELQRAWLDRLQRTVMVVPEPPKVTPLTREEYARVKDALRRSAWPMYGKL